MCDTISAEEENPVSESGVKFKYVHLYGDAKNETHFKDVEVPMAEADYAPPAPPIWVSPHQKATGVIAIGFKPGWVGGFHPAPKKQWMSITCGALEIGVSDGEKRTLTAGTVALLEEAGSKGHSTKTVGDAECIILVTELD